MRDPTDLHISRVREVRSDFLPLHLSHSISMYLPNCRKSSHNFACLAGSGLGTMRFARLAAWIQARG